MGGGGGAEASQGRGVDRCGRSLWGGGGGGGAESTARNGVLPRHVLHFCEPHIGRQFQERPEPKHLSYNHKHQVSSRHVCYVSAIDNRAAIPAMLCHDTAQAELHCQRFTVVLLYDGCNSSHTFCSCTSQGKH